MQQEGTEEIAHFILPRNEAQELRYLFLNVSLLWLFNGRAFDWWVLDLCVSSQLENYGTSSLPLRPQSLPNITGIFLLFSYDCHRELFFFF